MEGKCWESGVRWVGVSGVMAVMGLCVSAVAIVLACPSLPRKGERLFGLMGEKPEVRNGVRTNCNEVKCLYEFIDSSARNIARIVSFKPHS